MTRFRFDNSYARLPTGFVARVQPTPVRAPRLIRVNEPLAQLLDLDASWLASDDGVQTLAGNRMPEGAEPIATAYAGHQFGGFVPQLGDGRAILLGEVIGRDGVRRDLQLKGAGRTPFSRGGDGRAAIGPVLREYVVSEAMAALGIPTTRALAAVTTGEEVLRERVLPGAVLTRVASSHIRVGTFQFFAARGDTESLRVLADYVIARHYPGVVHDEAHGASEAVAAPRYRALLEAVIAAQAALIARWMQVGFIHGVMNTDNTSVAGETIDYGPCAFMDEYNPATVFSSIDRYGRYAYDQQPAIADWNLTQFASCLLPLLAHDRDAAAADANAALDTFVPAFDRAYREGFRAKLGLHTERDGDDALAHELLGVMATNLADFTLVFRGLCDASMPDTDGEGGRASVRALFADPAAFDAWAARWHARLAAEPVDAQVRRAAMTRVNPAFIPRNHRVEAVIRAATDGGDLAPFHELVAVLAKPYHDQPEFARYMQPPLAHERVHATFCGT